MSVLIRVMLVVGNVFSNQSLIFSCVTRHNPIKCCQVNAERNVSMTHDMSREMNSLKSVPLAA